MGAMAGQQFEFVDASGEAGHLGAQQFQIAFQLVLVLTHVRKLLYK
jgi:hypothetical protein